MTALLLLLAMLPTGTVQTGRAVEYRSGLMERVYRVRIHQGLVAPGWQGGFASSVSCGNIGRIIHARFRTPVVGQRSASWSQPRDLLVVDCSAPKDRPRHLREGLILETDWGTACQTGWCREGRTKASVWWTGETWR